VHTNFCDLCAVSISDDVKTDIVNGSFDCVISKNVFHVLSFAQSERLVLRMGQMLKSGGFVMGICLGAQKEKDWAMTPDGSEVRFLQSKKTLTAVFEKYGFQDVLISEMQLVSVRDELEQSMVPDLDDSDKVRLQFTATKS
jgi:cyclopropane fatty-acyl-phospholipid synthase-like methyltransferase